MRSVVPDGVRIGHWTNRDAWTGCTVCLLAEGSVASCEVRGGASGTLGSDILQPSSAGPGANAILLTGGSAFGLAAAGVTRWLFERGTGFETPAATVPLVGAGVVYDLGLGDGATHPDAEAGYAACEAASAEPERGSVGAGTGCTVGKLLGAERWTKGGFGLASIRLDGGGTVSAGAVVNAVGDVLAEDGSVLAGIRREGGGFVSSWEAAARGAAMRRPWREATTLVAVFTDVTLTKLEAWMCARAADAGVARAVSPVWTLFDGDTVFCASTRRIEEDPLVVSLAAANVVAEAIRDGVRQATGAPGCPAISEL